MSKKIIGRLIFILLTFCTSVALAYIPPYWMILSRTADNHGKGAYVIDQDVIFSQGQEPLVVNERWTILNESSMRVEVTGRKQLRDRIRLTYVYDNGRRYFIDENGVRKSEKTPDGLFEPYFHFRSSKNMRPILVAQNIAPSTSLKSEAHHWSQKKPTADREPYVRLSRAGGVIAYAIGTPTPISSNDSYPGIWIEQDQFVVRKIRLSNLVEVSANNFKTYSQGLQLPREMRVSWPGQTAKILVNGASSAAKPKTELEPSSLNFGQQPNLARLLPQEQAIIEFYTRMR